MVGEIGSPDRTATPQEILMTTRLSAKLAALAIALMMNTLIIGGVAYLFEAQTHEHTSLFSMAKHIAKFQRLI
jgi:hypothetical protein